MVSVAQDVDFAFAGEPVILEASSLSGDRARFKLTSKPYDSGLTLYDDNEENYLQILDDGNGQRSKFEPDVPGTYVFTCVDENVSTNVKHFSNDGGTGESKGLATATVVASATYTLRVGEVLQRQFGLEGDQVTLTVHSHNNGSAISGVMTYYAGKGFCGTLTGSTSPTMDLAMRSTGVTDVMAYYGMSSGYTDTHAVLDWPDFFQKSETQLSYIATGFNKHVETSSTGVHDTGDGANSMSAVSKPSSVGTLVSYTNTMRGKVIAHFALATGAAHPFGADTTNAITVATCTNLSTARLLLNDIRTQIIGHKILRTTEAHYPPGDNEEDTLLPWKVPNANDNTAAVITYATSIASAWDDHLPLTTIATSYHTATGSHNDMIARTGVGWDELQELANECADKLEAHAQNRKWDTGSAASYHTAVDKSSVVPFRASDRLTTVQLIDHLHWAYLNHIIYGQGAWHGGASAQNAGDGYVTPSGATTRLQHALLDRLDARSTSTPPNTLEGVTNLINLASFSKAN